MRADDHILPVAYIILDTLRAASIRSSRVWRIPLIPLRLRSFPSIEEDPHPLVRGEAIGQCLQDLGMASGHDYQRSYSPARLAIKGAAFDWHALILGWAVFDRLARSGACYAYLFSDCNRTTC